MQNYPLDLSSRSVYPLDLYFPQITELHTRHEILLSCSFSPVAIQHLGLGRDFPQKQFSLLRCNTSLEPFPFTEFLSAMPYLILQNVGLDPHRLPHV